MELKNYDDFKKFWFKTVYAFNTEIQRDEDTQVPYFEIVREGQLVCTYANREDKIASYSVREISWYEGEGKTIYRIELNASGITKWENIKIFTDKNEANKFANRYIKKHKDELNTIYEYVKSCTVTRAQIAEKFGIPVNDLVIDPYS